ncbi:LOW QUALITY PROTEIN: protein wings apart-like [Bacillus rossius redtenbacheri]|uniref:LOW QUALITY PROTEIN: protein wings apart-like n=1 Tax=Bacillus rossius redtenbacheri TaxID=93214 RepID=UPI002FDD8400
MSRGYSKVYSRKPNTISQTSIQFDKLFQENSNRPSAAKSAGTVGKWGVISCTSLRSSTFGDLDGYNSLTENEIKAPVAKPKKFFKSRNVDNDQVKVNTAAYLGNQSSESFIPQVSKKYGRANHSSRSSAPTTSGAKKFFTASSKNSPPRKNSLIEEQTEAMNLSSPNKSAVPPREEHKPPIVLRIFKGTAQLVSDVGVKDSVTASNDPALPSENDGRCTLGLRITRRRNYSEANSDYEYVSSLSSVPSKEASSTENIPSPKRSKESDQSVCEESVVQESNNSKDVDQMLTVNEVNDAQQDNVSVAPEGGVKDDGNQTRETVIASSQDPIEQVLLKMHEQECNAEDGVVGSQDTTAAVTSSLSTLSFPSSKDGGESLEETLGAVSEDLSQKLPLSQELPQKVTSGLEDDDQEKLLKAEELLCKTYVDFSSATEKLLMPVSRVANESSKPFLDHNWFSDSDDSNSISDQINSIAASQGEQLEAENLLYKPSQSEESDLKIDSQSSDLTKSDCMSSQEVDQEQTETTVSTRRNKKGSIFKSRSLLPNANKKRLALYKHKWADDKDAAGAKEGETPSADGSTSVPASANAYVEFEEFGPEKLTRVTSRTTNEFDLEDDEAITSVKCPKKVKGFYTVVRNVKKAHQIQESGEFQEFNDDVEYILDALQDDNPVGTRCLSAITLASKCMAPAFRMHVRAHGTVTKFFRALHDATKDQSLSLCTATVMFVLSQDQLNMDLDRHSLELMLNLLESDASHRNALDACGMSDAQLHKNKQRVRELCAEIQSQGRAKHLNLDNITVGQLAMETLLSLTSRRAGEWFKEELRALGGLEHIVSTICDCYGQIGDHVVEWTDALLDKLRKIDRCLRVLENITHQNEENQQYLLKHQDGVLVDTLIRLFRHCDGELQLYPVSNAADKESAGVVVREALIASLKVLINLTHDFNNLSYGSTLAGEKKGIMSASLHVLLRAPDYVPEEKKFDLLVLALILLINLVEHSKANRKLLFEANAPADVDELVEDVSRSAVMALIQLFYQQEEMAREEEVKTDAILDGKKDVEEEESETTVPKSQEEFIEETVAKLLQKAGRNMEHTLIGAYVSLLLGYLIMENKDYELYVRQCLPEGNFQLMLSVLQKVYDFMNLTASAVGSSRGIAQTKRVINYLTQSDVEAALLAGGLQQEQSVELDLSMCVDGSRRGDS